MSMQQTIDSLIQLLEAQKASGTPGSTPVVVATVDSNCRGGYAKRVTDVVPVSLAKQEFEKGWEVCRTVSNRGVKVVLIG